MRSKSTLKIIITSIVTGICVGFIVVSYRLGLSFIVDARKIYLALFNNQPILQFGIGLATFIIIGLITQRLLSKNPSTSGSGIPQVNAYLMDKLHFHWFRELIAKFVGGILVIGAGFSVGREGPSIHLGSLVGKGVANNFKLSKKDEKYIVTSGASAGLATAFNAPLSGVVFALEELHKYFSPILLVCVFIASVTADFISRSLLGSNPVFEVRLAPTEHIAPLLFFGLLIIFAILMALTGKIFSDGIIQSQKAYQKIKLPTLVKVIILMSGAWLVFYFIPDITGGGHELLMEMFSTKMALGVLIGLVIAKLVYTFFSYSAGFPGGIFFPLLVIGGMLGRIFGDISVLLFHVPSSYVNIFIILGMVGYLTAVVRAPLTGVVLILELTGSFSLLFLLTFIATAVYLIAGVIHYEPIYERMLHGFFKKNKIRYHIDDESEADNLIYIDVPITEETTYNNQLIKQLHLPGKVIIMYILRDAKRNIPDGDFELMTGDVMRIITDQTTYKREKHELFQYGIIASAEVVH